MKKYLIELFLIFAIAGKTSAQEIQFTSKITVTYDMYIMFDVFPYNLATLDFNNSEALFLYQEMGDNPNSKSRSKVIKGSDKGNYTQKVDKTVRNIYKNKGNGILLQYNDVDGLLIDSIQPIKWKYIENKTKKIADYDCFMAEGYFRGCYYTVWYTPDIPSSFGPWKLNGCPGLILEVTRDDKALAFYATKIESKEKIIKLNPYEGKKRIMTYSQLRKMLIDMSNENSEKAYSQRERTDENIIPKVIFCLECDFIDELKRFPNRKILRNSFEDKNE
jgi:GLPGLI family protein